METQPYESVDTGMFAALGTGFFLFFFALIIIVYAAMWKIFTKAGKPGWAAIIPIYNAIVLLEIVGKPAWWIILLIIPFVGFIIGIIVMHQLSLAFGQGVGMTILLIFGIGFLILGFGSAQYVGTGSVTARPV